MNIDTFMSTEIKKRLPDDTILWLEQPEAMGFAIRATRVALFSDKLGCFVMIFGLILLSPTFIFGTNGRNITLLMLIVLGVIMVVMTHNFIKARRTIYAITNKRLVILTRSFLWMIASLESYTPEKLILLKSVITGNNKGNLDFSLRSEIYRGRFIYYPIGFWAIDNVKNVEEMIRDQFHIDESLNQQPITND